MTDGKTARRWRSKLVHPKVAASQDFRALVPAVHRGSTVVFDRVADARDDWRSEGYSYGLYGTPTTRELALRIADLEGARASFVVPGGQAAIALIYLTYCRAGDHALIPESAYRPNRELADELLSGLRIEVEAYDPLLGADIAKLIRPNTRLIWCESPGTITMEVQDVPAIVGAAHAAGVPVALDNTYAAGVLFDAFAHGVDVSMQALTKYVGGHSDLLLGTVSAGSEEARERVGATHRLLGLAVSPDDCALALRGLETLAVRLDRLAVTALEVARWLKARPEIELVLHPALSDCPGHEVWRRDFTGSASVFSIVFRSDWNTARVARFAETLRLFQLGFSWGGTHSLVMAYPPLPRVRRGYDGRIVRLNVGLEEPADLIADLHRALTEEP
ncbi:cystathionine beta-lyase [Methylobacterium sp. UNC378MF]|uniref:cystathionine beta-lyase n=1 Tax=Methylobacterium sp. UNC378MF TaxID=1502748 RepID=UPI00088DCFD7|nr:cystathionine beta-lyase [Methylobacterium sp. UNC378MF]SDA15614.1 cystathionine beta-lyase [Methylobacterium sp. UNC378MF]